VKEKMSKSHTPPSYYVPGPSYWPIKGSLALFCIALGSVGWMNEFTWGKQVLGLGFALVLYMLWGWFSEVIRENLTGLYSKRIEISFRWSMAWFIFSELMFFAAFFGALFYVRVLALPELAGLEQHSFQHLWKAFSGEWPTAGPLFDASFSPMEAWGLPAINTLLLITSGGTLTWAHWGLLKRRNTQTVIGLFLTVALGALFLYFQATEYGHAYEHMNLKLTSGIYGSLFFIMTGFHGLHVTIGALFLTIMMFRAMKGHFTPENHFAFEAAAWYWHFVDVVWILLFIVVYAL
jgi:cytochrome c oxidase subunit III